MKSFEMIYRQLIKQFKEYDNQPSYFDVLEITRRVVANFQNAGKTRPVPEVLVHYCTDSKEVEDARKLPKTKCEEVKYNNMEFFIFSNWLKNRVDVMYCPVMF